MRKSICVIFWGLLAGLLMPLAMSGATRESCDSVRIFFRQSRVEFVPGLNGNKENVERFAERVRELSDSGVKGFKGVKIVGSASPEGSVVFNRWLSEHRAAQLMKQLGDFGVPDNQIAFEFLGRIVIKLCLGVDVAKSEDEEFSVVDAVEFSPESLDFRVY